VLFRLPSLIPATILLPSKGVSNTSSLSISFNSHSGASARVLSRKNVLSTIGTDYRLHECLELRQSGHLLNAYQDPVQTWSYLEYSCLVVFKDIVPTSSAGNSSNRIRKFSMCCFKCRYGFIATMSTSSASQPDFSPVGMPILALVVFLHHFFICSISVVESLYQPVYNGRFSLLSQFSLPCRSRSHPHKSSAEV